MKIIEIRTYSGRNIFSHKPVVKMVVDVGDLAEVTSVELSGFNECLLKWFPGLRAHCCSTGYEGGFVDRLYEGTFVSHVTEHLALELQCVMGYDVCFGKTRILEEPSVYTLIYEYVNERCAADFGREAVKIVAALARNKPVLIADALDRLQGIVFESNLGPSTQALLDEAVKRNIPVRRIGEDSLLQLGYGKHTRLIEASLPDTTSCIAVDLAKNKQLAKVFLQAHNIPVPEGYIVDREEAAVLLANQLGYPVVVKPYNANQGKGVTTNIDNENLLRTAYHFAGSYSNQVIVEKHVQGKDYRILVVGDQVSAVAERRPPYVVGNGIQSIAELAAEENKNAKRGKGHEKPLTEIKLDSLAIELLARSKLTEDSIPESGEIVYLRENGNLSTGGSARDCTTEIHSLNKALAVMAAKVIGLEVAGIDVVCDDISQPLIQSNGAIIEINAAPGLRMHLYPTQGKARNVAADILNFMYPQGTPSSIPIISITGTNGKTTVTRMIRHVLSLSGKKVGMTCSSGTYIGEECISQGDNTGPRSAHCVLYNKEVEVAVLETARGGIVRKGLGYDLADIGLIINVSEDHLGLDGINTLEDLAFAKALVIEAVKPDGYAILNADDDMAESLARSVRCNLIYFSQYRNNSLIQQQINQGGIAVVAENGDVMIYWRKSKLPILKVKDIPITFNGRVLCNIENSLAAISCLFAVGVPDHIIRLGLTSFTPDPKVNSGRFNLFDLGDFQVILDYAHNPSGYLAVIQFIKSLHASRLVGVIGMPGDRMDRGIYEVGLLSGQSFSKLYIKEDDDLRGRQPAEVAYLLYDGALRGGLPERDIQIIFSETDALEAAIYNALPGDLIVMFYESFEKSFELVQQFARESTPLDALLSLVPANVPVIPPQPAIH